MFHPRWANRDKSSRFGSLTTAKISMGDALMPECFCPSRTITGLEGSPRGEDEEHCAVGVMYEKAMQEREEVRGSA
jgi:hypothetical protein